MGKTVRSAKVGAFLVIVLVPVATMMLGVGMCRAAQTPPKAAKATPVKVEAAKPAQPAPAATTPATAAQAPVANPALPSIKDLMDQLLPVPEEWKRYYPGTPPDQLRLIYNVWVLLNNVGPMVPAVRDQQATITQLQARVAELEKKLTPAVAEQPKTPDPAPVVIAENKGDAEKK